MRYLPLLLANLRRKKIRTVLTVGSFAVALFLFGLLFAVRAGFRQGIDAAGSDRLMVMGTSIMQMLPLSTSSYFTLSLFFSSVQSYIILTSLSFCLVCFLLPSNQFSCLFHLSSSFFPLIINVLLSSSSLPVLPCLQSLLILLFL